MPDFARELFESIRDGGHERVEALIEAGGEENLYIDFKESREPKDKLPTFAKAACALANTLGGVIVWGVEAKDNKPPRAKLIATPVEFATELNRAAHSILDPGLPGIESLAVPASECRAGFVVTFVPKSTARPHRCLVGDRAFYARTGSSNILMSTIAIRDAMLSRSAPLLELAFSRPSSIPSTAGFETRRYELKVRNTGGVPASSVAFAVEGDPVNSTPPPYGVHFVTYRHREEHGKAIEVATDTGELWLGRVHRLDHEIVWPGTAVTLGQLDVNLRRGEFETRRLRYAIYAVDFVFIDEHLLPTIGLLE